MSLSVLHFATDDKFMPRAIALFEAAFPRGNIFRLLRKNRPSHFVPLSLAVTEVEADYFNSAQVREDVRSCQLLVIHGLRSQFVDAVNSAPDSVRVVWCGWGFDYYTLLEPALGYALLPLTGALTHSPRLPVEYHPLPKIAARIDVCSVLPTEMDALRVALPQLRGAVHPLRYYTTEDNFETGPTSMCGADILLGNSADPTNNHLDALEELNRIGIGDGRIIVPLSYGAEPDYIAAVVQRGTELFGRGFVPLETFVGLAEFNQLISTCGVVAMNHRRQQALGTISHALYKGAKAFVRPESPVFRFYEELGVRIERWEASADGSFMAPLSAETVRNNRRIVGEFWSQDRAIAQVRSLRNYL